MEMSLPDAVVAACPEVDPSEVREFLARIGDDYRARFAPEEMAAHVRLAAGLDEAHPARLSVQAREARVFDVVVVAFDYFSELSVLCGLLASFGLDIEWGSVFTFGPGDKAPVRGSRSARRATPKKIVDLFRVRLLPEEDDFDAQGRAGLEAELLQLVRLIGDGRYDEARDRLDRRLVEHLERVKRRFGGILYPVEVRFDNAADPRWTVLEVEARDTPAFLFAVTRALSARGVYVHRVEIENRGRDVHDRFHVSDRRGAKIESAGEQDALRTAIVLTKQFTHVLPWAPDPAKAARHFDQLLDKLMEKGARPRLLQEEEGLARLARLLGSSDFLWDDFLRMQFESLMPVLDELKTRPRPEPAAVEAELRAVVAAATDHGAARRALNRARDRQMFLIDLQHLVDPSLGIESFSRAITGLAEAVVRVSLEACDRELARLYGALRADPAQSAALALFGLGKFGGAEMGYASDLELLFVRDGAGKTDGTGLPADEYFGRLALELAGFIEARAGGLFHIDLRLRPYGRNGPMVSSRAQIEDYYRAGGGAEPFERQALIKLRFIAGDPALGRAVTAHRDAFTYGGAPWDRAMAVHLRERQRRELVRPGEVNLKYSEGGLLDVEYGVQYLQIEHGFESPELRTPTTLVALARLHAAGLVSDSELAELREGYLFLRRAIEALRMVRGEARDLVLPPDGSDALQFLARRLGYAGASWAEGARRLQGDVDAHRRRIGTFYARRFETSVP
jgi:[glutamine synthetase] adenylyltransferase / [glutamine synthetase]-adenylyl-L-tyrosine phosphorylase